MPKHTSGEWVASGDQVVTIDGNSIADVYGGQTFDECEANARLIAASPDMLEALDAVVFEATAMPDYVLAMVTAAIDKAEGNEV